MLEKEEIKGLPVELLKELSWRATAIISCPIIQSIKTRETATLDQILVDVWRSTGKVWKRTAMTSELYRMAGRGEIQVVPGKKGVYQLLNKDKGGNVEPQEEMPQG